MLVDQKTGERYTPLNHLREGQPEFCVYDSLLSEAAVLGFDYGYSLDEPNMLIMWEAQFGDFANGAQVIIDQFIASAESKWGRGSGLVMLLPHGYEGQGPEHSSARLERFLQLCAEDNIQVAVPTTPAQYFHLLRRQVRRDFRKPLIVMTPKSLLRHKLAVSPVDQLTVGHFHDVLDDPGAPDRVRRVAALLGKGLLRPGRQAGRGRQPARSRDRAARAALSLAGRAAQERARAIQVGPRVGLGAGRVAKHGGLDVRGAAAPRADRAMRSSTSGATPAPARRPARSWSTTANRPRWSRRPSAARRCPTWSPPRRSATHARRARAARSELKSWRAFRSRSPAWANRSPKGFWRAGSSPTAARSRPSEPLFELETDKASSVVPAPSSGVLKIGVTEGETVADRRDRRHDRPGRNARGGRDRSAPRRRQRRRRTASAAAAGRAGQRRMDRDRPLSPAVRRLVAEEGVDVAKVAATGPGGRVTKGDVAGLPRSTPTDRAAARRRPPPGPPRPRPPAASSRDRPPRETRQRMSGLRQKIAQRLVEAQQTAAILTTFNEADMSRVMDLRAQYKEPFQKKHGVGARASCRSSSRRRSRP